MRLENSRSRRSLREELRTGLRIVKDMLTGPGEVIKEDYADDESRHEDDKLPVIVDTNCKRRVSSSSNN
jgi:hypothetical protein